jgi:hypothetical protein
MSMLESEGGGGILGIGSTYLNQNVMLSSVNTPALINAAVHVGICMYLTIPLHHGREWPLHHICMTALKSWRWYRRSTSRVSSFTLRDIHVDEFSDYVLSS